MKAEIYKILEQKFRSAEEKAKDSDFNNHNLNIVLRAKRNKLLQQSDWTQGADSPLSAEKKAEWATYRQGLRDLLSTHNETTIHSWEQYDAIPWPTKPE
jgi:hypothetical protein